MSSSEAHKIESYLTERKRTCFRDPARAASRVFYELWEKLCCPQPFQIDQDTLTVGGSDLSFPENKNGKAEGVYCWDDTAECPKLRVRTSDWEKCYLIRMDASGGTVWDEQETVVLAADGTAEIIDAVREIARMMKADGMPAPNPKLKLKEFQAYVERLTGKFPPKAVRKLKKLCLADMRAIFQNALADLAGDELDDQLILPLNGTYAREHDAASSILKNNTPLVGSETRWRIKQRLNLIERSARLQSELERDFSLSIANAELLRSRELEYIIGFTPPPDIPVRQDDILTVMHSGTGEHIGTLRLDLAEGDRIVGCLRTERKLDFETEKAVITARMPKGPLEQYADSFVELNQALERGETASFHAAAYILGIESAPFQPPECPPESGNGLNPAQRTALEAACMGSNPVVIIQGPPGTGKTYLLEQIVRRMQQAGLRILVGAPSHAAVDNLCRRIMDLPFLRCARNRDNVDPALWQEHWAGTQGNYRKILARCGAKASGLILAGTLPGLLRDFTIENFQKTGTEFDVILIDEAGMAAPDEAILAAMLAERIVLLGDHRQLPPFPRHKSVLKAILKSEAGREGEMNTLATRSIMEWLISYRKFPAYMLNLSYRCRNPRLLRFASTLFYNGELLPNPDADYYRLPPNEREKRFPKSTLRIISTSRIPEKERTERFIFESGRPGIWNPCEAQLAATAFASMLTRYALEDITVISPYRRQITLLRKTFTEQFARCFPSDRWNRFQLTNIATVDSFQGGESEAVIISYVRSNTRHGVGFTDNANRINVAYTRCRTELAIICDLDCLKNQEKNELFHRLERAVDRDGEILTPETPDGRL